MRIRLPRWRRGVVLALALSSFVSTGGCDRVERAPDARVEVYAVDMDATPGDPAGLAYLEAVAAAHADADAHLASDPDDGMGAAQRLRPLLDRSVPAGDAAVVVHLELAARYAELSARDADGASEAIEILEPLLAPTRQLPLHAASARALVALGDAAAQLDDHALAAGSYARSVRVMSQLRKQVNPDRDVLPASEERESR